ncbi:MAG: RasGAP domain-containing protein, partial [Maioricimonas sp. JB045]
MQISEEEYVNMLAGVGFGEEGPSGVYISYDEDEEDFGSSTEPDLEDVTTELLDFRSTINTKKLRISVPRSSHKHHNQRYLDNVLEPINQARGLISGIHDTGTATPTELIALLELDAKLAEQEKRYSDKVPGKKRKKTRLTAQTKVAEIKGYRDRLQKVVAGIGPSMVTDLASKVSSTAAGDKEALSRFVDLLVNGDSSVVEAVFATSKPKPRDLAAVLSTCPATTMTKMCANVMEACKDSPEYVEALIRESLNFEATSQSPSAYFRGSSPAMKLIMEQKRSGEIAGFLKQIGGDVQTAISQMSRRLEIDPKRRKDTGDQLSPGDKGKDKVDDGPAEEPLEDVVDAFATLAKAVLKKLTPEAVPDPLCGYSRILYEDFFSKTQDKKGSREIVSSFLFIRYISPVFSVDLITNPPGGKRLTPDQNRIAVMLSKVLQNIGNQTKASVKEPYMKPFDTLVDQYAELVENLAVGVLLRAGVKNP